MHSSNPNSENVNKKIGDEVGVHRNILGHAVSAHESSAAKVKNTKPGEKPPTTRGPPQGPAVLGKRAVGCIQSSSASDLAVHFPASLWSILLFILNIDKGSFDSYLLPGMGIFKSSTIEQPAIMCLALTEQSFVHNHQHNLTLILPRLELEHPSVFASRLEMSKRLQEVRTCRSYTGVTSPLFLHQQTLIPISPSHCSMSAVMSGDRGHYADYRTLRER
ncbi:hypothetical protein BT63DRAFT_321357 [Microthyrium microscopicum]|uniref:Uncharacterized protein n=1 Tax=Microthyrium microscopicum TaxID=703497 RepID=A0A6A6U3M7_9PEZI|nr:hypothetical protein BT63DRAFT_321357 [Microthyrium microscopicum]